MRIEAARDAVAHGGLGDEIARKYGIHVGADVACWSDQGLYDAPLT